MGAWYPHLCVRYCAKGVVLETGFKFLFSRSCESSITRHPHCVHLGSGPLLGTVLFLYLLASPPVPRWRGMCCPAAIAACQVLCADLVSWKALVCTGRVGYHFPRTPDHMSKSDSEGVPELLVLVMFFGSGREVTLDQFVCRLPLFLSKGL